MLIDSSCLPDYEWPLSAKEGTLICHPVDAVTFTGGGGVYAVNGMAMTREIGEDIEPIWLDNPDIEGAKINIGPLIDLGSGALRVARSCGSVDASVLNREQWMDESAAFDLDWAESEYAPGERPVIGGFFGGWSVQVRRSSNTCAQRA